MGKVSTRHSDIVGENNRLVGCGRNNIRGARERVAGGDLERGRSKTSVDLDGFSHHDDSNILSPFWLKLSATGLTLHPFSHPPTRQTSHCLLTKWVVEVVGGRHGQEL